MIGDTVTQLAEHNSMITKQMTEIQGTVFQEKGVRLKLSFHSHPGSYNPHTKKTHNRYDSKLHLKAKGICFVVSIPTSSVGRSNKYKDKIIRITLVHITGYHFCFLKIT